MSQRIPLLRCASAGTARIPPRIGIDGRALRRGPAGIATYVRNLLEQIPELDPIDCGFPRNNFLWNQTCVPAAQVVRRWRLYHAPAYTAPLLNFCPLVLSVADVSYLAHPEWYPYGLDPLRRRYYLTSIRRADRVLVCSQFTREELVRICPEVEDRLRMIYLGVSRFFRHDGKLGERVRREFGLPERFLLHVGDIHARRNLEVAAGAAEKLGLPLVLVGKVLKGGEAFSNWPRRFSGLSEEELKGFYSAATAFVYPSLYEGFGLPVLEAMACGLPVVAARRSCLPEVCGEAALLVEPEVDSLVAGIRLVLGNREDYVQGGLARAQEFSWEKTARQTMEAYKEILNSE